MTRQIHIPNIARAGAAALLLLAMLAISSNDAAAQVECSNPAVPEGSLELVSFPAGSHVAESGAGLAENEMGTAIVELPAGASVVDAYVYWSVRQNDTEPNGMINLTVNGGATQTVEGDCIGFDTDGALGAPSTSGPAYAFKYGFPTTELNAGAPNTIDVEVLDADISRADGFSAVILYTTSGSTGYSQFYEGADFIWGPAVQVSSSLTIDGEILEQCTGNDLTLHLKVGDTTPERPNRLTIEIDGTTFLEEFNFFGDAGQGWESQWSDREIVIGSAEYDAASSIDVELASEKENDSDPAPSSLTWVVGGVTCSATTEIAGCTRTPGYWRNNGFRSGVLETALASAKTQFPDAFDGDPWASDLTVADAQNILNQDSCSDISYCLQKHLLATILNVANGATNTIASTVEDAIDYLESSTSVDAEDLKNTLDRYNNGLEGPPSCDSIEDERIESPSAQNRNQLVHSVGPNPFNPTTQIHFELTESMPVKLGVYDVLGREVRILIDGVVSAGEHRVHFDANGLPTGTYFYRFTTPEGAFGGQMLLLK